MPPCISYMPAEEQFKYLQCLQKAANSTRSAEYSECGLIKDLYDFKLTSFFLQEMDHGSLY